MRYVWTVEQVDELEEILFLDHPTREKLAEIFNCHVNTVYNYEEILKDSQLSDVKKYYWDENGNPKRWVELNGYLGWLICQVKDLKGKLRIRNKSEAIKNHLFSYPLFYSEENYHATRQKRREKAVQQPTEKPQKDEFDEQGSSSVAA